ncbi:MAG: RNB domain-containing ribonuclease [Lentisphaerae bacterium]|jgi:ribonuclease R|nr:RNB domain-containing ribonuclease [Lentisphaerota bacterium]MBT4821417.1 RNB domain-containing ribonuclease [Lentisphaerota bacterium]MBT5612606.1 RNB domain-containing ribonuclease [Lentisphaerota bacterium]MBT7059265.1 RNB domain-containing ribonuclease [Lentisphaerota bacterium]MBT7845804.1 RNB domain-containing ribonuclease [Lentisphaerota bacterium]
MPKTGKNQRRSPASRLLGTYAGHVRGFGFFVPDRGGDDLFVPPGREGAAIDGDTVEVERGHGDTVRVVRVVRRGRPRLAGTYLGKGAFSPDAHHIGKVLNVEGTANKGDKLVVAATPDTFKIDTVLGRSGAPDVEDSAVLAELDIDPAFPPAVTKETSRLQAPAGEDFKGRLDLRKALTVVTIDPASSRDFDDAISLEREGGNWVLGVHIADVSHYVRPGTAVDKEAYRRGTSVYLPSRVIPMLPEKLSNDLCSLREGKDRLALSVQLRYSGKGDLIGTRFAKSVIRPDRRFSYERASRVMDRTRREPGVVGTVLQDMLALSDMLRKKRRSLEMPRDRTELVFDAAGNVVDLRSIAQDVAHGVIEEFMLAANQQVARLMLARGVPGLFRHHPAPEDLAPVWEALKLLGLESARKLGLARAIRSAAKAGHGPAISSAVFRCMSRARYTTEATSHFSLAFDAYCHFTSPIRRYTDLVTHRELHKLLEGRRKPLTLQPGGSDPAPTASEKLEAVADHLNARSAAAERAESRIRRRRVLEFLLRQGSIPTAGQVTGVVEKGLMMDLSEYGISGFLAVDALPGGPYQFEPGRLTCDRRAYRLGQDLDVCIHRIDPAASQLDLALAPRY